MFRNLSSLQNAIFPLGNLLQCMPNLVSILDVKKMAAEGWRGALTSVTETVFPKSKGANGRDHSRLLPIGGIFGFFHVLNVSYCVYFILSD